MGQVFVKASRRARAYVRGSGSIQSFRRAASKTTTFHLTPSQLDAHRAFHAKAQKLSQKALNRALLPKTSARRSNQLMAIHVKLKNY